MDETGEHEKRPKVNSEQQALEEITAIEAQRADARDVGFDAYRGFVWTYTQIGMPQVTAAFVADRRSTKPIPRRPMDQVHHLTSWARQMLEGAGPKGRLFVGAMIAIALVGCVMAPGSAETDASPPVRPSPASTFVLTVRNVDGPQANILIGDQKVATLNCWDPPVTITAGDPGLPALPWAVTILDISHPSAFEVLGTRTETGNGPSDTLVIRTDHVDSGTVASPYAAGASPCPPAPSAEPLY